MYFFNEYVCNCCIVFKLFSDYFFLIKELILVEWRVDIRNCFVFFMDGFMIKKVIVIYNVFNHIVRFA